MAAKSKDFGVGSPGLKSYLELTSTLDMGTLF